MSQTEPESLIEAPFEVPRFLHLLDDPRLSNLLFIGFNLILCEVFARDNLFKDALCGKHTCLQGIVRTLDLLDVKEARRTASKHASWKGKLRNCMVATFVETACTVR